MLGPEFWCQAHASEQERGNGPCSILRKGRVSSVAPAGITWNDPLLLRPCSALATSRHLTWRVRCLKENRPCDKKLQALKKTILAQRRRCISRPPEEKTPGLPFVGEPRSTKPLKRKVCKAALSAPACPGRGGRTGQKLKTQQNTASSSLKAQKERAVNLFGASAWREGQKLARNILGPPLKYSNLNTGLKTEGKEPIKESQRNLLTVSQLEQSFGENGHVVQPEMEKTKQESQAADLNCKLQDWKNPSWIQKRSRRHQKAPYTEKGSVNQPRSTGRAKKAGSKRGSSDGLKTTCSPKIKNASANAQMMGMRETSRHGKGSGSPLRSDTSRKERQPTTRLVEGRRKLYSPEEIREFMDQKAAERNRRIQEERRISKQAHEEKNKKLQEVYRKQREAVSRKSHCEKQLSEDVTSIPSTKNNPDLKYTGGQHPGRDDTKWVHRVSQALLKNESKFNSESNSRMANTRQVIPVLGLCPSMDPEGQLRSPLKLKHLGISSPRASDHSPGPFLTWRGNIIGMETPCSSDISTSSYRSKQERVKAIHNLAKDLSERLGREMKRLQATKTLRDQGCPPGTPSVSKRSQMITPPGAPHEKLDAPEDAEGIRGSRPSLDPSMCPQGKGERACLEEGSGIPMVKERIIQHLQPVDRDGLKVMQMDSLERRHSMMETKGLNEGGASKVGFGEKDPSVPAICIFHGGQSIHSVVEAPEGSYQKNQPEGDSREKKPLKHQPGHDGRASPAQRQASGPPSPSAALPPAEDPSEPADSNSQWSEISQFYGGSGSFGRLSLTLVEQSLREEELRARHQSALLRLREKALQEKAQAELAWLAHGERCPNGLQGTGSPSSTAEKQLSILTKLKQEQVEIRHLHNIGRAAHQERKLLLQQQKDLLEVQKTTTRLWLQLAGKLPHQISPSLSKFHQRTNNVCSMLEQGLFGDSPKVAGTPNPQGPAMMMLEKEKVETSFKPAPLITTCSGGFEARSGSGVGKKHLAEPQEILPQENWVAGGFSEWKPGMGDPPMVLEATTQGLYDSAGERSQIPALCDGRTADHLASQEEKEHDNRTGLTKNSQEGRAGYPLDKGPEGLASTGSSSKLHGFSPYPEKSPSGLEFCKAHAILVNLSGSSCSPSDLEDEDLQDTDVSLPEEFVSQEQPPENLNVSMHHETPVVPRIVINRASTLSSSEKKPHVQISGGGLESEDLCVLYSQEKVWEDTPERERLDESGSVTLSDGGRLQRASSPLTKKDPVHPSTFRSSATSLNVSDALLCAENDGNKMASQSPVDPGVVFSSTNVPFQSPEDQGAQDPALSFNVAEEDGEDENTSHFGNKNATVTVAPGVSLKTGTPQNSEVLTHSQKHSFCLTFPNSSDHLIDSDGKTGYASCSAGEHPFNWPDEITLQLSKTSQGNVDIPKENQSSSSTKNQNANEAGMATVHLNSPKGGLPKNEGDAMHLSNKLLSELEDDVLSPVDDVLTYGSSDLPSSTDKDASSWSTELPAPPENLSGKDDEASSSTLDFPSPPDPLVSSEAEELSPPCNLTAESLSSPRA